MRRNKTLWFFGLLAVLAPTILVTYLIGRVAASLSHMPVAQLLVRLARTSGSGAGLSISGAASGLGVTVLAVAVAILAEGCLIAAASRAMERGKAALKDSLARGCAAFLPLAAVGLLALGVAAALALAFSLPIGMAAVGAAVVAGTSRVFAGAFIILGLALSAAAAIAFAVLMVVLALAARYVVVAAMPGRQSLAAAWRLLKARPLAVAVVWWSAVGLAVAAFLGASLVMAVLAAPASLLAGLGLSASTAALRSSALAFVALLLAAAWLATQSLIGAFFSVYWTLAYQTLVSSSMPTRRQAARAA